MKYYKIDLPALIGDQSGIKKINNGPKLYILGHLSVLAFVLQIGISNAQEFDIENYCIDMAKAQYPDNNSARSDYKRRCIGTLEVQRKYKKETQISEERKKKEQQSFDKFRGEQDYTLSAYKQYNRVIKASDSKNIEVEIDKLRELLKECTNFSSNSECDQLRLELKNGIEKAKEIQVDLL